MTGKKSKEIQKKADHLTRLNESRARRGVEPTLVRVVPTREEKPTILIVCEGKNTEPSYFKQFRLTSAKIIARGEGYNTLSLIEQAAKIQEKGKYDQVWCVFDKDSFTPNNFNNAIQMAEAKRFGIAYSNQAFEYWLILHFEDHQGSPLPRSDYNQKINRYLNPLGAEFDGKASKKVSSKFFDLLFGNDGDTGKSRTHLAITRAKRNFDKFDHSSPALEESSTTVFRLVAEILKYV